MDLNTDYQLIIVESYYESGSGLHGDVHVRPLPDQGQYKTHYRVECSHDMWDPKIHPVGTKFRIRAKVINRQGTPIVYTFYDWPYEVLK